MNLDKGARTMLLGALGFIDEYALNARSSSSEEHGD